MKSLLRHNVTAIGLDTSLRLPAPCPFYFEGQPEHPTTWGAIKAEIRAQLVKRVGKLKEAFDF